MTPWKWHYRRMFFLLLFGLAHAYLIWMGDILVGYAICGSLVFLLRKKSFKSLWIIGGILFLIPILLSMLTYYGTPPEQLNEIFAFFHPSSEEVNRHTSIMLGSYLDQMPLRIEGAIELQTIVFLIEQFWRIMALMILGMILYRKGVLSGEMNSEYYRNMLIRGLLIGIPISAIGLYLAYDANWNGPYMMNIGSSYNYVGSLFTALAYIGGIILIHRSGWLDGFLKRLQMVGRMAFTNYILMSVLCTLIFNGHGLGYFGQVDRLGMWLVVFLNWAIILIVSPMILNKYRYGPLEWLWRKLTYWNI